MTDDELISAARKAREQAYAPYSGFPVGAALVTADGQIFTGCNVENASYGLTNCAERTAIFKAVSEGHKTFIAMALIADTIVPCSPCGACRQVMSEFGPEARVIMTNLCDEVRVSSVRELLPSAFRDFDLLPRG